jgi:anthranilate/para-aminobenzoate synthase component II
MIVVVDNTNGERVLRFLPKLLDYLDSKGIEYIVIKGNHEGLEPLLTMDQKKIDGIILSGSPIMLPEVFPHFPKSTDPKGAHLIVTNMKCIETFSKKVPILGICFGCQLMNIMFDGTLENVGGDKVLCETMGIKKVASSLLNSPSINKGKFCCKYMPKKVADAFVTKMTVDINGKPHACLIKHKRRPLWGSMFHPEALKSTHVILDKFMSTCNVQIT